MPLGATPALLFATSGFRLRLGFSLLRLCLSPLPLRFPTLLFAATLLFPAALLFAGLLFAGPRAVRPFVAPTSLFRAFGALLRVTPPAPLPVGFRVGAGDRDVSQDKRTADRDRAVLSASISRETRHVPACLRALRRARERS